jgi:hypothetical protein
VSELAVAEREIAPGIKINAGMTGAQILNAHLQAAGEKPLATGHVSFSGPQGHPHTVVPDAEAGKPALPAPAKLEVANKPNANQLAEFDAEMRASGKQLPLDRPDLAGGGIDQAGLDALTAQYRALIAPLYGKPDAAVAATMERFKRAYENDVKSILEGRKLTAAQIAKLNGTPGNVDSFLPKAPSAPAPTAPPVVRNGWQSYIEDGQWVGLEHITTADTHGYTIPRYVKEQRLHVSAFDQLRVAKAAGITQAQVNAVLHQEAISKGWVKA